MYDLEYLFRPRSIAVVGISTNSSKWGGGNWLKALQELGFEGKLYPVNPSLSEFAGIQAYPSVKDIPDSVDLVIVSIPALSTPQLMEECVSKGVKFVHLYTAGFTESGEEEGTRLEAKLVEIACKGGVRIIGPNCMGPYCPGSHLCWRLDLPRESGPVALFSQSGWNVVDIVRLADVRGVQFNKAISYGNACDLNETDFLEYFVADPEIKVIAAYIEGVREGQRFLRALRKAAEIKPVIIIKGGRTAAGARATASHTAALSGADVIWDSLLRQAGAIRVHSFEELIDTILAFLHMPVPRNRNAAIIGSGGGPNVLGTDDCESAGLYVPPLPSEVREKLRSLISDPGTSIWNPIDSPFGQSPTQFQETVRIVASCQQIGSLIIHIETDTHLIFQGRKELSEMRNTIIDAVKDCNKNVAVVLRTAGSPAEWEASVEEQKEFAKAGLSAYPTIARASQAINKLLQYHGVSS